MSILDENELMYEKIKVSMRFKQALDKFMKEINDNIIPDKDIEIKGYKVIKKDIIKKHYFSIEDSDIYNTIKKKIDRTELILAKYIENENEEILESVRKQYKENTSNLSKENNMNELKKLDFVENKIKTGCKTYLKNYFKNIIPNIIEVYIKFLTNIKKYMEIESSYNVEQKIKANIANLKEQKVEFEDLSALIYLKSKICESGEYEKYKHIAIDEAQDFGDFSFYALKYLLKNSTFSIFGDLAQSIYQYRGIKSWKEVSNNTFESKCETKYLLKSYRTTTEIMNSANEITNYIKLNTAQPVIRHGKQVNFINYNNYIEQIDIIKNILNQYKENEYKTVAIICKDEEDALLIHKELKSENIEINIITNTDRQYDGGVCIITSYLAKGLEFDGVIISNAS